MDSKSTKTPSINGSMNEGQVLVPEFLTTDNNNSQIYEVDPFAVRSAHIQDGDYVEFRTMGWIQAGFIATAENIGISLLSFPSVYYHLGMAGATIATLFLGILAYVAACVMVDFKLRHQGVLNYPDIGAILFGKWGRRILAIGLTAKSIGVAGSQCVVGQTALRTLAASSSYSVCGVWWALLIAAVCILMSPCREWAKVSILAYASVFCVMAASFITVVAVAVQNPDILVPPGGDPIVWHAFPAEPSLINVISGLTNIVFAFAGCSSAMSFSAEMRCPRDFKKSFALVQSIATISHILVGALIYAYGGQYVTSPALTMASPIVRTIAYSIVMVTVFVSGVLIINVGAKYIYVSYLRTSPLLTSKSWRAHAIWIGIVTFMWILGFIVSQLIPFLNQLLTIISALFAVWFSYGLVGAQWLYDNHPRWAPKGESGLRRINSPTKIALYMYSIFSIIFSCILLPLGLYSGIMGIKTGYSSGTFNRPFSCS